MRLPFPLLWVSLVAMWLALNRTVDIGHVIVAALVATAAVFMLRALEEPSPRPRRPLAVLKLASLVLVDVIRSNVAVATIVLTPGPRARHSGFLDVPLALRSPAALATLACIITATPGTSWAGYDARSGMLTMHVLDLVDEEAWLALIKDRYERWLLEIFE
jgi:multicomponent K+:H+ antiporter subunit E